MTAKPKQVEEKRIAKGYIRVSTTMQREDGISLETQTQRIQEYCAYKKLDLVKVYQDAGISGKNITGRPGMQELLSDIQKGDSIIVCDLSRLARNTKDALTIVVDHIK